MKQSYSHHETVLQSPWFLQYVIRNAYTVLNNNQYRQATSVICCIKCITEKITMKENKKKMDKDRNDSVWFSILDFTLTAHKSSILWCLHMISHKIISNYIIPQSFTIDEKLLVNAVNSGN